MSTKLPGYIEHNMHIFYIYQNMIGDPSNVRFIATEGPPLNITGIYNERGQDDNRTVS